VLNAPHVIGRKVVDTLERTQSVPDGTLGDLSKASIKEAVLAIFGGDQSQIGQLYTDISDDMERYTCDFLHQAAELTSDEYDQVIVAVLEENLPKAIELLRRIQEGYRLIYNQTAAMEKASTQPYVERGTNPTAESKQNIYYSRLVDEMRALQLESFE
jgi:hypothetical protein